MMRKLLLRLRNRLWSLSVKLEMSIRDDNFIGFYNKSVFCLWMEKIVIQFPL